MCYAQCLDKWLPCCSLGVTNYGRIICMCCRAHFDSKKARELALKERFGDMWPVKLRDLLELQHQIKRSHRKYRTQLGECVYFIDPPVNAELHLAHMNYAGQHIFPKLTASDKQIDEWIEKHGEKLTLPAKFYLADYGCHE